MLAAALLAGMGCPGAHAEANTDVFATAPLTAELSPEQQLQIAVEAMREGRDSDALNELSSLVQRRPDFRLAQLLYARLLALRSGSPQVLLTPTAEQEPRLRDLLDEYRVRVGEAGHAPAAGSLPADILKLTGEDRYALLADLPHSRLYLLSNEGGELHVIRDYYATLARNGYGKHISGDLRTPVGIYRATGFRSGASLPAFYGAGAFTLNYPNGWDRSQGRSGFGIWLHGVPAGTYSRPPRASEGCLVLANDDLLALKEFIEVGNTPVIFSDHVDWLPTAAVAARRGEFEQRLEAWRVARESANAGAYSVFYDEDFRADDALGNTRLPASSRAFDDFGQPLGITVSGLDLFSYPGEDGMLLAQFVEDDGNGTYANLARRTTQYWQRNSRGEWKIVREESSPLSSPHPGPASPARLRTAGAEATGNDALLNRARTVQTRMRHDPDE